MNLHQQVATAGNGGQAKLSLSERRIGSGDPPHGEFEAGHSHTANLRRLTAAYCCFLRRRKPRSEKMRNIPRFATTTLAPAGKLSA